MVVDVCLLVCFSICFLQSVFCIVFQQYCFPVMVNALYAFSMMVQRNNLAKRSGNQFSVLLKNEKSDRQSV